MESGKFNKLIDKANQIFLDNFKPETCFERAVFYSWACKLEECCKYCYMGVLPIEKRTKDRVRSFESLLAETIIIKKAGWDYGFLSGGVGVFSNEKLVELLKLTNKIFGEKVWVNIGVLNKEELMLLKPYIKGVVGTVEVLDPKLHQDICPSKPIEKVEEMFEIADSLGISCGMTLIVGLGETINDFDLLCKFINKNNICKIHIYGLNPQKGTIFENKMPPSAKYQAEWIARTRIEFPKIDIQCGIWKDRIDRVSLLLRAGANSISKYPAIKLFGSSNAKELEKQADLADRTFCGTLSKYDYLGCEGLINELDVDSELKEKIKDKLESYLALMGKNCGISK